MTSSSKITVGNTVHVISSCDGRKYDFSNVMSMGARGTGTLACPAHITSKRRSVYNSVYQQSNHRCTYRACNLHTHHCGQIPARGPLARVLHDTKSMQPNPDKHPKSISADPCLPYKIVMT